MILEKISIQKIKKHLLIIFLLIMNRFFEIFLFFINSITFKNNLLFIKNYNGYILKNCIQEKYLGIKDFQ